MKSSKKFTRRRFLATTAAASAVTLAPPFIRTSCAAGKLKVALWDHWVPGANKAMETLCHDWAAKNRVDISIDFITSHGNKLELTVAAEKLAKSGHDLVQAMGWYAGGVRGGFRAGRRHHESGDEIVRPSVSDRRVLGAY